ncbi:MAG TPA: hypothetical protein VGK97_02780 [Spongiibacteraceae bacterium]
MHTVETDWWLLDLPEEWGAEQDEETIVISDQDGIGALEITRLESKADNEVDLGALAKDWMPNDVPATKVRVGDFNGLYFQYEDEGDAVREWLLRSGNLNLLVSYACDCDDAGLDDEVIDEILETLTIKLETH